MISPQHRSALFLVVVALAALAVSLALALVPAPVQRPRVVQGPTAGALIVAPTVAPPAASTASPVRPVPSSVEKPGLLWTLLAPWALVVDALAVLGMAAVLALQRSARCRRRA